MLQVYRGFSNWFKLDGSVKHGFIFRLNYKITSGILFVFSLILTTCQYVGKPIHCVYSEGINEHILNCFCWIHSTYTTRSAFRKDVPHLYPGIATDNWGNPPDARGIKTYNYYQWVVLSLAVQAAVFYLPRLLWKNWGGDKINILIPDCKVCSKEERVTITKSLSEHLYENLELNNWWTCKYFLIEFLALINVIGQMLWMNRFLDGEFLKIGYKFMMSDEKNLIDSLIFIFPRMTKCTYNKFGDSGQVEQYHSVCILALNNINEKIYIFLWFWFMTLAVLTSSLVVYRIIIIACPRFREYVLLHRLTKRDDIIDKFVKKLMIGDWFVLCRLQENMDSSTFSDVMKILAEK